MAYRNVLVTGANRGIGLEFVKQFLGMKPPVKNIIATTRSDSDDLNVLKASNTNLHILKYESVDYDALPAFVDNVQKIVGADGLDLLVNNAGIFIRDSLDKLSPQDLLKNIETNSVAPIILTQKLLPLLKTAAKQQKTIVAQVTSLMGSIDDNTSGGFYAYRSSKSALNMMSKSLSMDIKADNVIVLLLHPGWVQTNMGTSNAPTTPEQSVSGMLSVIKDSSIEKTGAFIDFKGKDLKW